MLSQTRPIQLETTLGNPRLDPGGIVDLLAFEISKGIDIVEEFKPPFAKSFFLLILKLSSVSAVSPIKRNILHFVRKSSRLALGNLAIFPNGVGYSDVNLSNNSPRYIVGNFHSYKWFENPETLSELQNLRLKNPPAWLRKLESYSEQENPIVVHVRAGDYKNIAELGILSPDYFDRAISRAVEINPDSRIWVFSDGFEDAMNLLPKKYEGVYRFITDDLWNSAAHLEAMRLGKCFVLSNSTFSWWAAFLRHDKSAEVFCPERWFLTKPNPEYMIPLDWQKVALT